MYCPSLSSSFSPSGPFPWSVDGMCPIGGTSCECADHFYTPPQSPAAAQSFNLANRNVPNSPTTASAPSQSFASFADTPHYPHAPPSTPTTFHWPEQSLQLWSSEVYKSTINFPPSELPEHLRDGAWCHMQDHGELAVLFGPEAAIPFNWTPITVQQPGEDSNKVFFNIPGISKFVWGPLDASLLLPRENSSGSPASVESQVCDKIESAKTKLHEVTANNPGSSLDSNEVEA